MNAIQYLKTEMYNLVTMPLLKTRRTFKETFGGVTGLEHQEGKPTVSPLLKLLTFLA